MVCVDACPDCVETAQAVLKLAGLSDKVSVQGMLKSSEGGGMICTMWSLFCIGTNMAEDIKCAGLSDSTIAERSSPDLGCTTCSFLVLHLQACEWCYQLALATTSLLCFLRGSTAKLRSRLGKAVHICDIYVVRATQMEIISFGPQHISAPLMRLRSLAGRLVRNHQSSVPL